MESACQPGLKVRPYVGFGNDSPAFSGPLSLSLFLSFPLYSSISLFLSLSLSLFLFLFLFLFFFISFSFPLSLCLAVTFLGERNYHR